MSRGYEERYLSWRSSWSLAERKGTACLGFLVFRKAIAIGILSLSLHHVGQLSAEEGRKNGPDVGAISAPTNPLTNPGPIATGKELFEQDFRSYDGFLRGGDGLGPMFNEVSCAACHHQGGMGGGGALKHNVDIVSVSESSAFLPAVVFANIHPGFVGIDGSLVPSLVLHRYGTDTGYQRARTEFLGKHWIKNQSDDSRLQAALKRRPVRQIEVRDNIHLIHSQRNTPALFGAGLIDQIPEELLRSQAAKKKRFGVAGRVSQVRNRRIGRFGWRAQLPDLKGFVLSACANELGLEVEGHSQARDPMNRKSRLAWPEIDRRDTDAMIEFVATIKAPELNIRDGSRRRVSRGLRHFNQIGCAECHVRHMGKAQNVFADILLHDMGKGLSDPVGASREIEIIARPSVEGEGTRSFFDEPKVVNMYYVGTVVIPQITTVPNEDDPNMDVFERFANTRRDPRQEWRTPPLWGCADSAPYMHDGRAATLHDAIKWHGGESSRIRSKYLRLTRDERGDLLAFLACLKVP